MELKTDIPVDTPGFFTRLHIAGLLPQAWVGTGLRRRCLPLELAPLTTYQLLVSVLAAVVLTLLAIASEYSGLDLYLEGLVFDPAAGSWPYRSLLLTSTIMHTYGRYFVVLLALLCFLMLVGSCCVRVLAPYRKAFLYVLVTGLTGTAIVSLLKSVTHIYTPWSLAHFGGSMPYIRIFDSAPPGSLAGHAFPGGHASGGFAWFGVYFLLQAAGSPYRWHALLATLLLGGLFSATQELRGAHFLSHDLFSLVICWTAALCWALVFFGRHSVPRQPPQ